MKQIFALEVVFRNVYSDHDFQEKFIGFYSEKDIAMLHKERAKKLFEANDGFIDTFQYEKLINISVYPITLDIDVDLDIT